MQHPQHAFSYILKEICKIVEMQLTTSGGAGIQETEIQAKLHISTIVFYIY